LLGYYFDLGVQGSNNYAACKLVSFWNLLGDCDGHHGDSEHVVLTIYYNPSTRHWLLEQEALSHHFGYIQVTPAKVLGYPNIQYAGRLGTAPLIWVAQGKHANYTNQQACEDGNGGGYLVDLVFSFDTCGGNNSFFTPTAGGNRNIGSQQRQLINCVASQNPFYQNPPRLPECFWSAPKFFGWQLDHTTSSDGYIIHLRRWGFAT
jgi:hypothetical protein